MNECSCNRTEMADCPVHGPEVFKQMLEDSDAAPVASSSEPDS